MLEEDHSRISCPVWNLLTHSILINYHRFKILKQMTLVNHRNPSFYSESTCTLTFFVETQMDQSRKFTLVLLQILTQMILVRATPVERTDEELMATSTTLIIKQKVITIKLRLDYRLVLLLSYGLIFSCFLFYSKDNRHHRYHEQYYVI